MTMDRNQTIADAAAVLQRYDDLGATNYTTLRSIHHDVVGSLRNVLAVLADDDRTPVADSLYDALVHAVDRAKTDDRSLDTDEYVGMALSGMPAPAVVAQQVLDDHAIKPDWRRNGEQIHTLIVEGICRALGQPVASQTDATPALQSFADDRELLDEVLVVLPMESSENPMPFVEVVQRVTRKSGYTADEVRGALLALDEKHEAVLQYGRGWSRTERD